MAIKPRPKPTEFYTQRLLNQSVSFFEFLDFLPTQNMNKPRYAGTDIVNLLRAGLQRSVREWKQMKPTASPGSGLYLSPCAMLLMTNNES